MRLSPRSLIDLGFAIALLVLLLVSAISFRSLGRLTTDERAVAQSQQVLLRVEAIVSTLKDAETGQRGYLLTRQDRFLEPYHAAAGEIDREMAALETVLARDSGAARHLGALRTLSARKLAILGTTVELGLRGDFGRATAIVSQGVGKELMDQIRRVAAEMIRAQEQALVRRQAAAVRSSRFALWMIGVGTALAFLLVGIARFGILRGLAAREQAQKALARREQALRRLYEVTSAPAAEGTEKFQALLAFGCEHFGLSTGLLSRVRGDRWEAVEVFPRDAAVHSGDTHPLGEMYCGETLSSPEPVSFEHAAAGEWARHPSYAATGVEAYLGAPVMVGGRQEGTLCFIDRKPHPEPFQEGDRDFLRILAQWAGGEIERRQAEEALRAREERYRSLVESASDLIYTTDADGRLTYVNPPFVSTTGYSDAELLGRSALSLVRPDQRAEVRDFYRAQWRARRPVTYHRIPIITRDGREIWLGQSWVLLTEAARWWARSRWRATSRGSTRRSG